MKNATMVKALVLLARAVVLEVRLRFCKSRAKRFAMLTAFEKKCS